MRRGRHPVVFPDGCKKDRSVVCWQGQARDNRGMGQEILLAVTYGGFVPAAGAFLDKPECRIPRPTWERFQPEWYYAGLVDLPTLEPLRIWSWKKV